MGLISRVSSRTYRDKSISVDFFTNFTKMNKIQISRRLLNSIRTDGKGKAIPNAGPQFLRGNPLIKKYLLTGENKFLFQRRPLYWGTKKWAVGLIIPNAAFATPSFQAKTNSTKPSTPTKPLVATPSATA